MQDSTEQTAMPTDARIRAKTRRQAMDWSLVLASQGIHPVIENDPETGWALVVPTKNYEAAVQAIQLYRRENLHWGWQRRVFKTGPVFDWASSGWVLLTVVFHWWSASHANLRENGVMDTVAVSNGQWWRLFTATLLHGDLAHLAGNAAFGFILIGFAMGRYGTGVGLLAAYLAGVGGNIADWLLYSDQQRSLGASGVVMGALGLLAAQSLLHLNRKPNAMKFVLGGIVGGIMLFVLLGLSPGTDVIAHLGGFVSGVGIGALLALVPNATRAPVFNLASGFVFALLVVWPWTMI